MTQVLAQILLASLVLIKEERRTRFKKEYHDILTALNEAKNKPPHLRANSTIDLLDQRKETFLEALASEINENNSN